MKKVLITVLVIIILNMSVMAIRTSLLVTVMYAVFAVIISDNLLKERRKYIPGETTLYTKDDKSNRTRRISETHLQRRYSGAGIVPKSSRLGRKSGFDVYAHLSAMSGGTVIASNKTDVDHASRIAVAEAALISPVLVMMSHTDAAIADSVSFSVDGTLDILLVEITGVITRSSINIRDPGGVLNGRYVVDAVDSAGELALKITSPKPGIWKLRFSEPRKYEVKVKGSSAVSFQYSFMNRKVLPGLPPFVLPVIGNPLADKKLMLKIEVNGFDQTGNITTVTLYTLTDDVIATAELIPMDGRKKNLFWTEITLPEQELRIAISGSDNHGNPLTRMSRTAVSPIPEVTLIFNTMNVTVDGEGLQLPFTVTNNKDKEVFKATVISVNKNMEAIVFPVAFTLERGEVCTGSINVTSLSPELDTEGNITLSITDPSGYSKSNNIMIQIPSISTAALPSTTLVTMPVTQRTHPELIHTTKAASLLTKTVPKDTAAVVTDVNKPMSSVSHSGSGKPLTTSDIKDRSSKSEGLEGIFSYSITVPQQGVTWTTRSLNVSTFRKVGTAEQNRKCTSSSPPTTISVWRLTIVVLVFDVMWGAS